MTWAFIALLVIAAIGFVLDVRKHWARLLNPQAFVRQLLKLIEADNVDRARKLCNAGGTAWLATAAKTLILQADDPAGLERAYERVMLPSMEARVGRTMWLALVLQGLGLAAALGTVALAFPQEPLAGVLVGAWAGMFAVNALMRLHGEVQRARAVDALESVRDALRERA